MVLGVQQSKRLAPRPASGELTKALLVDTTRGVAHSVMYNPEELRLEQGNDFAEVPVPGLRASPVHYVRGKARVLSMELLFDSYEPTPPVDVRTYTGPIVALLDKVPQTNAPPILLFALGQLHLRCVLVDATQRFTMFLRDGTPVRSTMSVRLQEFVEVTTGIRQGVFFGSPTVSAAANSLVDASRAAVTGTGGLSTVVHVVTAGDTLSALAGAYLGDPAAWRRIADVNEVEDPLQLTPGASLVIPPPPGGRR